MEKEVKHSQQKSNNKALIVIIIILSMCVGVLGTIVATTLLVKPNSGKETTEEKEVVAKEIKDIDILTELSTKIDTIMYKKTTEFSKTNAVSGGYFFKYNILKREITSQEKQQILLDNLTWDVIPASDHESLKQTELYKTLEPSYGESFVFNETKKITLEKANAYSKELFGEEITTPSKNVYSGCPSYFYEASLKAYFFPSPQCGGIVFDEVLTYKSKFEEKGDEAYVNVSFAYTTPTHLEQYNEKYAIYKDFTISGDNQQRTYKDLYKTDVPSYEMENFTINEENYKEFSEYKFTFKKDKNNNYYFVKVEQTK